MEMKRREKSIYIYKTCVCCTRGEIQKRRDSFAERGRETTCARFCHSALRPRMNEKRASHTCANCSYRGNKGAASKRVYRVERSCVRMYMYIYVYIRREYVGRRGERERREDQFFPPLSWQLLILKKMRS